MYDIDIKVIIKLTANYFQSCKKRKMIIIQQTSINQSIYQFLSTKLLKLTRNQSQK